MGVWELGMVIIFFDLCLTAAAAMKVINCIPKLSNENPNLANDPDNAVTTVPSEVENPDNPGYTVLTLNVYYRFETTNFPYLSPDDYVLQCHRTFLTNESSTQFWFVLTNGVIRYFDITGVYSPENYTKTEYVWDAMPLWFANTVTATKMEFSVQEYVEEYKAISQWRGFQGFLYATTPNELSFCPLAGKTFNLIDNKDVIPITSSFTYPSLTTEMPTNITCQWSFTIPPGYKLKIHLKQATFLTAGDLKVAIANISSINLGPLPAVHYFEGAKFSIIFQMPKPGMGFGALVSAVAADPKIIQEELKIFNSSNSEIYNWSKNYENNVIATYSSKIIAKSQTVHLIYRGFLEPGVDNLTLIDKLNNKFDITLSTHWIIDSKDSNVTLILQTDDSQTAVAPTITVDSASCICSSSEQLMSDSYTYEGFGVMEDSVKYNYSYCAGMKCSFSIIPPEKAENKPIIIMPRLSLRPNTTDSIKIFANNVLFKTVTANDQLITDYQFEGNTSVKIEFQSDSKLLGVQKAPQAMFFCISLYDLITTKYTLTKENATLVIDLSYIIGQQLITISAPKDFTLEMFGIENLENYGSSNPNNAYFHFYDSDSTENRFGTYDDLPRHSKYHKMKRFISKSNFITIFTSNMYATLGTLFFRLKEIHSSHCSTDDNVIPVTKSTVSYTAASTGSCFFTVLFWPHFYITSSTKYLNLKTDSILPVKLVADLDSKFEFLEFSTQKTWSEVNIYGVANSFIIPANKTINFLAISNGENNPEAKPNNISRKLFTSSSFSDALSLPDETFEYVKLPKDGIYRLTVKFLDLSPTGVLSIYIGPEQLQQNITRVNQTFDFQAKDYPLEPTVYIKYIEPNPGHRGYVIEYGVVTSGIPKIFNKTFFGIVFCFVLFI